MADPVIRGLQPEHSRLCKIMNITHSKITQQP